MLTASTPKFYVPTILPFGLSSAPHIFQNSLEKHWRHQGIWMLFFLTMAGPGDRQVCSSIANATKRFWWGRFYHIWRKIGLLASVCMYVFSARELASFTGQIFLHHQFPGMSPKLWLGLSAFCLERPALGGENSIRSVLHWRVAFLEN